LATDTAWQNKPGTSAFACEAADQRGATRQNCDKGAFESNPILPPLFDPKLQCDATILFN
jgi:hypothetical protein